MGDRLEVVVYGATGYTGRLVCRELDALGVRFAVAGRDAGRLKALSDELPSHPQVFLVSLDDAPGLR
ncbi:MAG: hypothetical protein ACK4N5_13110, partial [Myxococcales bacterium]